jgi:hypothetical protein
MGEMCGLESTCIQFHIQFVSFIADNALLLVLIAVQAILRARCQCCNNKEQKEKKFGQFYHLLFTFEIFIQLPKKIRANYNNSENKK